MKKIAVLFLISFNYIFSQTNTDCKVFIKTGINTAFYSGSISKWKGRPSYSISLGYQVPLNKKISIQPEIQYNRLNADSERTEFWPYYGNTYVTIEEKLKLSIISLPITFKYEVCSNFFVIAGPQLNYISFAERERPNKYITEKPNAYIKEFDFGPKLGFEYDFKSNFFIEVNYFHGLLSLDKNPNTFNSNSTNSNLGNLSIATLNLGYKF